MKLILFLAELLIFTINATPSNDTTNIHETSNINPNQVVISRHVLNVLVGVGVGALLCCGCGALCFCIGICCYYKNTMHLKVVNQADVEQHQRLQSPDPSIVSIQSSVGSKYTQSEDNTKSTKSPKLALPSSNKEMQKLSLHRVHTNSMNTHALNELAQQQKRVTRGRDIVTTGTNYKIKCDDKENRKHSKHCTFDSEELYIDKSSITMTPTPCGDAVSRNVSIAITNPKATNSIQIEEIKCDENAEVSRSSSTLTLPTLLSGPEGDRSILDTNNTKVYDDVAEMKDKRYSESKYTMDGHRGNIPSEGNILTKRDKQYEMNKHHIPDIPTLDTVIDIDIEDDCKSIHHHTVKQHRKHRKDKSGNKYQSDIQDDQVLVGIDMNQMHISPFQCGGGPRYHTQPNLKYIPKNQFLQHPKIPQYISMANVTMIDTQRHSDAKSVDINVRPHFVKPKKTF